MIPYLNKVQKCLGKVNLTMLFLNRGAHLRHFCFVTPFSLPDLGSWTHVGLCHMLAVYAEEGENAHDSCLAKVAQILNVIVDVLSVVVAFTFSLLVGRLGSCKPRTFPQSEVLSGTGGTGLSSNTHLIVF